MKKILIVGLVAALSVVLVACGPSDDVEVNNDNVIQSGDNLNQDNNLENESGEDFEEEIVVSELEKKINALMEKSQVMIRMPMAMPIDSEAAFTYIGLSADVFNANVKEAMSYESMIMPANQSVCLIELNDTADVASIKKQVLDNCDPNKWICMSADKCLVVDSGRYIMLVMSTQEDCDALQKAFAAEFGNAGEALTK